MGAREGVKLGMLEAYNAINKFTPPKNPLRAAPRRVAATNNYDEVLQALFEKNWSKPSPRELIAALALEGVEINVQQATPAVRRFTPVKTLVNRPHEPTHPSIRALGLKLQQNKARHHQRRRMPAASTGNYVKRMQEKLMQKRAAILARTYGGQLEASRNAPRRTPPASTSDYVKRMQDKIMQERARPGYGQYHQRRRMPAASTDNYVKQMQDKIMQKRAAILAKHPEYDTWAEYKVKEQAKADKLKGQYHGRRRMPDRRMPGLSNNIKAIQEKLMQERAEILARHPEYATWAEYKVKEQAKADKLQGQYRQRRRMPAASTHPRIEALQMKLMQERAEILARHPEYDTWAEYKVKEQAKADGQYRIKAIQKKLMQERAAILAKYPEYETWAEYMADMTPDMIRN